MDTTKYYYLTPHLEATARKWLDMQGLPLTDLDPFLAFIEAGAEQVRSELSSHHSFAMRAARVAQENGDEMQYWREYFVMHIRSQMENGEVPKVFDSRDATSNPVRTLDQAVRAKKTGTASMTSPLKPTSSETPYAIIEEKILVGLDNPEFQGSRPDPVPYLIHKPQEEPSTSTPSLEE